MFVDYRIEKSDKVEMTSVLLHFGYTMDPYEIKSPKAPDYWVDPPPKKAKG